MAGIFDEAFSAESKVPPNIQRKPKNISREGLWAKHHHLGLKWTETVQNEKEAYGLSLNFLCERSRLVNCKHKHLLEEMKDLLGGESRKCKAETSSVESKALREAKLGLIK